MVKKTLYYFVPPKDLELPPPEIDIQNEDELGNIKLKSKVLIKNIFIKGPDFVDNNYFDMEPGVEYKIKVLSTGKTNQKLTFISLYDILSQQ